MILSFFKSPLDEELKTVREKNREYESAQERLSSEKVRQTISDKIIISCLISVNGAVVKVTQWVMSTLDSIDLFANCSAAFLCIPNVKTCLHLFAVFF